MKDNRFKVKIGMDINAIKTTSGIKIGPLKLPEGMSTNTIGGLVAFGEDKKYLHCILSATGSYYGVFKSPDENHMYQRLLELNA